MVINLQSIMWKRFELPCLAWLGFVVSLFIPCNVMWMVNGYYFLTGFLYRFLLIFLTLLEGSFSLEKSRMKLDTHSINFHHLHFTEDVLLKLNRVSLNFCSHSESVSLHKSPKRSCCNPLSDCTFVVKLN